MSHVQGISSTSIQTRSDLRIRREPEAIARLWMPSRGLSSEVLAPSSADAEEIVRSVAVAATGSTRRKHLQLFSLQRSSLPSALFARLHDLHVVRSFRAWVGFGLAWFSHVG